MLVASYRRFLNWCDNLRFVLSRKISGSESEVPLYLAYLLQIGSGDMC